MSTERRSGAELEGVIALADLVEYRPGGLPLDRSTS
jgi:hypothetical protein